MMSLLRKYKQILVLFFAALITVVFSNVVFAQQPPVRTNGVITVATSQPQDDAVASYRQFVATHLEPNFYQ